MKTLIIYYSYQGHTKTYAEKLAVERQAELVEIKDDKIKGIISAFFIGAPSALMQKGSKISLPQVEFSGYQKFVVCAPIWAGFPAPAFNSLLEKLPKGCEIEIILTSGGGSSPRGIKSAKVKAERLGLNVLSVIEVKTAGM